MDGFGMIAFDIGASNGRAVYGILKKDHIELVYEYRFDNTPEILNGKFYWDAIRLFHEIKKGMAECVKHGYKFDSVGISTWGNSIALLDKDGDILINPYHYRDINDHVIWEDMKKEFTQLEMFQQTGYKPIIEQPTFLLKYYEQYKPELLKCAKTVLMMPDLFNFLLTGVKKSEQTIAATSQMYDLEQGDWNKKYIDRLGIRTDIFPEIAINGSSIGPIQKSIVEELKIMNTPTVVAVAGHDTASASGCIESGNASESLYLSCGTWCCMGCSLDKPIKSDEVFNNGLTNDLGVLGSYNMRSNHTGLWLIQECRRAWESEGIIYKSWGDLIDEALVARPFTAIINTESIDFYSPGDMPAKIQQYCKKTGQSIPKTIGEILRVIHEGLALQFRYAKEKMEKTTGIEYNLLNIVGGGSKNDFLCKCTANAIGCKVISGPSEATVLGNLVLQGIAMNRICNQKEGLEIIRNSSSFKTYSPDLSKADFDKNYKLLLELKSI